MPTCTKCHGVFPDSAFGPRKASKKVKKTLQSWCRECKREHDRATGPERRRRAMQPPVARRQPAKPVIPVGLPKAPPAPRPAQRAHAGDGGCRWTDSSRAPWRFCGEACVGGSAWCEAHFVKVYQPKTKGAE